MAASNNIAKAVFLHPNGWASSSEVRLKQSERRQDDGSYKRVYFIEVVKPFHVGGRWEQGETVDALIMTADGKAHYSGTVEGIARSGMTKILLTSPANSDQEKIKSIYTKIGEFKNGKSSITG